ncbi:hypothetical protein GCM10009754_55960 [Amycolatopsis minnesotensis]|uniref:Uncharacterized protein n=1 Tax=Amycolatopsis minnesotensis TaxID=337894 RepID=A0ABN2RRR9_9PSEU
MPQRNHNNTEAKPNGTGNASGTARQGDQRIPFRGELSLVTNDATCTEERQFPTARRRRA